MEVITYKQQTSITKYMIEAALEYRPPLNISRNFFSKKKKNYLFHDIQMSRQKLFFLLYELQHQQNYSFQYFICTDM